jgi:class 3 adenylate cyclase
VVGNIGAPDRLNYTVVGDAANVAQRLEQHGKSIDDDHASAVIVVSGPVMRDAGPGFRFAPLGDAAVKGRDEPVRAFRLVGVADGASAAAPADVAVG